MLTVRTRVYFTWTSVQCPLTTQISACLQEQVGLMSISSWTLSFSSSPRTWLNFFMKSWAFPASGRFSGNTSQSEQDVMLYSTTLNQGRTDGSEKKRKNTCNHAMYIYVCVSYLLAMLISFPNIAVLLASDYQENWDIHVIKQIHLYTYFQED